MSVKVNDGKKVIPGIEDWPSIQKRNELCHIVRSTTGRPLKKNSFYSTNDQIERWLVGLRWLSEKKGG